MLGSLARQASALPEAAPVSMKSGDARLAALDVEDKHSAAGLEDTHVDLAKFEEAEAFAESSEPDEANSGGGDDREPRCYTCELEYLG